MPSGNKKPFTSLGQFDIPTCHFSERFLFRKVFIPKGSFSELYLVLWSERLIIRRVIAPKILIPKSHCSERFWIRKVFIPNGFYPKRFLIRAVLIPKGRFSEIRNKNLSDQKPFGSKNFMMSKYSPKLSYSPGFSQIAMAAYGSYFP